MRKPTIGIIPLFDEYKESYWMIPGYMLCIEQCGAIPVILPLTTNEETIESLINLCDGFLLTGGHDVNPKLYNEEKSDKCHNICFKRDEMETILFNRIIKKDKPTLAVCRGLQLINVILGGSLYQDLETQKGVNHVQKPPYDINFHKVDIINPSPLYNLLKEDEIDVNSYHHQAIKDLAKELKPMAVSKDGLIEAVYMKDKKFIWGLQWHPELNYKKEETSIKIIKEFIRNCI